MRFYISWRLLLASKDEATSDRGWRERHPLQEFQSSLLMMIFTGIPFETNRPPVHSLFIDGMIRSRFMYSTSAYYLLFFFFLDKAIKSRTVIQASHSGCFINHTIFSLHGVKVYHKNNEINLKLEKLHVSGDILDLVFYAGTVLYSKKRPRLLLTRPSWARHYPNDIRITAVSSILSSWAPPYTVRLTWLELKSDFIRALRNIETIENEEEWKWRKPLTALPLR